MRPAVVVALLVALTVAGCSSRGGGSGGDVEVVATTTQAADMARAVAGSRARVAQVLRPGADPHEYEPRPSDAEAVARARLVVRSGGDVDSWLGGLVDQAGGRARVL